MTKILVMNKNKKRLKSLEKDEGNGIKYLILALLSYIIS